MRICPAETGGFVEKNTPICRKWQPQEHAHSRKHIRCHFHPAFIWIIPRTPRFVESATEPHICQKRQLTLPAIVEKLSHICPTASLCCRNLPRNCRQNPRIGRNIFLHLIVCQAVACSDIRLYTIFIPISIFIFYSLCYKLIIRIERAFLCFKEKRFRKYPTLYSTNAGVSALF